jgi:hypothetical protein
VKFFTNSGCRSAGRSDNQIRLSLRLPAFSWLPSCVQRPKLAWHERWFISTLAKGLKITVGHGMKTFLQIAGKKPKVTMEYPEQKWDEHLPEYYRGALPSSPTSMAASAA